MTSLTSPKTLLRFICGGALALSIAAPTYADVRIIEGGRPVAKIYVQQVTPEKGKRGARVPESKLTRAIRDFNYHLNKMSGTELEVVETTESTVPGPGIVVGSLAVKMGAVPEKAVKSEEGFRLLTKGNQLLVGGQSEAGTIFGLYEVLQKLGCDWVMPGPIGEIIPAKQTVIIPDLNESQAPDFLIRNLWYSGRPTKEERESFALWKLRQLGGDYNPPPLQTIGHAWSSFIVKHKAEFDKDPTMYALVRDSEGKLVRKGPQIESTHPRVLELMVQDIKDLFAKNKWPKDKEIGFPVGPADGYGYSLSTESMQAGSGRIDPVTGQLDRTDEIILLGNKIQEQIEKEYPNVWVGFYSYSVHADYPVRYKPHPRTAQIFAPITFSRFHSLLDSNSKTQSYYRSVVERWSQASKEQGNALIFRGYNWNLADNMLPYTKLKIWGEELPYYYQQGFLGLNVEATVSWSVTGPSDWLYMKMAWDTKQDWKKLLTQYCQLSFGDGAPAMERYLLRLVERQHGAGHEAGSYQAYHLIYDDAFVKDARKDFADAKKLAKTADQKTRVDYIASSIDSLKLYLDYHAATRNFDFVATKAGYDAMLQHQTKVSEVKSDLVSRYAISYMKRYLENFVTQSHQYSQAPYKIVHRLPDELPTHFDPTAAGEQMKYFSPNFSDKGFIKTKTYSSTWDAQGLGTVDMPVWYRDKFTLPANQKGQPIGLFLGGFDDQAKVWLNGKFIGSSVTSFSRPATFDLTDAINYTGENVLVIQIKCHAVNELGVGGIIRPSFLFSGPRLAPPKTATPQVTPVLPGGGEVRAD
jgi:hypothetical protein